MGVIEVALPNWTDAWLVVVGMVLAWAVPRLDDRSVATVVLFVFAPVMVVRYGMSQLIPPAVDATQATDTYQFMFIFFFLLFHTGVMLALSTQFFSLLNISKSTRHLYVLHCLVISEYGLRSLQPMWGDPTAASLAVSALIFLHLAIAYLPGLYFGIDKEGFAGKIVGVAKTPLPYAFAAGILLALIPLEAPWLVLDQFSLITGITIPAALIVAGIVWGRYINLVEWNEYVFMLPMLGWCVFFQLILSPAVAMAIVPFMQIDAIHLQHTLILACGAPVGVHALLITAFYRTANERRFSVLCLVVSAFFSLLTLPLLKYILLLVFPVVTD